MPSPSFRLNPRFLQLRDAAGLAPERVAETAGITVSRLARTERGTEALDRDEVVALARALNGERTSVDPLDVVKPPEARDEWVVFTGCGELVAASGLAAPDLAGRARMGTWVVHTLRRGEPARRYNAEALNQALGAAGVAVPDPVQAFVPQRWMPNCRTLRDLAHWTRNRLAREAAVERETIESLESGRHAPAEDAWRIFEALAAALAARQTYLSASEVCLDPDCDPFPFLLHPPVRIGAGAWGNNGG